MIRYLAEREPVLSGHLYDLVIRHRGYGEALSYLIAASLGNAVFNAVAMSDLCNEVLASDPVIITSSLYDLNAVRERDPACENVLIPYLYYKGFKGLQAYRIAHALWEAGRTGETYIVSGDRISVRYILDSVRHATGRAFRLVRIPLKLAAFVAGFTPYYYRWTHKRPRFTSYSLDVLRSNSHVSHAKATRELGYHPRPLFESISDTAHWFLENLFLFYGPA